MSERPVSVHFFSAFFFFPEKTVECKTYCRVEAGREKGRGREAWMEGGRGQGREERDRIMGTHTPEHVCLASCGGPEVSAALWRTVV